MIEHSAIRLDDECPDCGGSGYAYDDSMCGDPTCCPPGICPTCDGSGSR